MAPNLLHLDKREPTVVENHDRKRDAEPLGGCNLAARHLEAAVAEQTDHRRLGARKLGRDRARQAETHG